MKFYVEGPFRKGTVHLEVKMVSAVLGIKKYNLVLKNCKTSWDPRSISWCSYSLVNICMNELVSTLLCSSRNVLMSFKMYKFYFRTIGEFMNTDTYLLNWMDILQGLLLYRITDSIHWCHSLTLHVVYLFWLLNLAESHDMSTVLLI